MESQNTNFEKELEKAGFYKKENEEHEYFEINKPPLVFKQALLSFFINMKDQIPYFLESLSSYLDENLSLMLTPVTWQGESNLLNQETAVKFMLNCPIIQFDLACLLIEKVTELSITNEDTHTTHIKSILYQFRWIDSLVKDEELLDKFIELIEVSQTSIKQELIGILPEIFLESHPKIVDKLLALARNNLILFVPIIECLGHLSIPISVIDELLNLVFAKLKDIELDCLPVAIHFLISISTDKTLPEILNKLRKTLDIDYYHKLSRASSVVDKDSPEMLIIDAFNSLLMSNMALKNYWVKLLDSMDGDIVYSLDLLVLIILHSQPSMKKKIETLIKGKVQTKEFKVTFVRKCIKLHLGLMTKYTMEFIHIAEFLLRGSEEVLFSDMSAAIYSEVFFKSDAYYQQEVVGSLVTHIGSGNDSEIDCALQALTLIVDSKPAAGLQFSIFIKGILDCLDKLSHEQIEKLFFILAGLCIEESHEFDGPLANEIQMILRKQLMHPSLKYKNIGIIASLAMVQKLSQFLETSTAPVPGSSSGNSNDPLINQAIAIVKLIQASCPKNQPYLEIAYDRLSHLIENKKLNSTLVNWILESISPTFTLLFSDQYSDVPPKWPDLFRFATWHVISDEPSDLSIIILPTVVRHLYNPRESTHPVLMSSLFKLYKTCGYYSKNTLECIEGILELGVVLSDKDKISELTQLSGPRDLLECSAVGFILAMNWYRELINTFLHDPSQRPKLIQKLQDLLELEENLQGFHLRTAFFVNYGILDSDVKATTFTAGEFRKYLRTLDPEAYILIDLDHKLTDADHLGEEAVLYLLDNYKMYLAQVPKANPIDSHQQQALTYFCKLLNNYLDDNSEEFESPVCELLLDDILLLVSRFPNTPDEPNATLRDTFALLRDNTSRSLCYSLTLKLEKVLSNLARRIPRDPSLFKVLADMTTNMNQTSWGKLSKKEIQYLLGEELYFTLDPIATIERYYTHLIEPYLSEAEDVDITIKFPNFVRATFTTYYELVSSKLVTLITQVDHQVDMTISELFAIVNTVIRYWNSVVHASTLSSESVIHALALRFGRMFVDACNCKLFPLFDLHFTSHLSDILATLRTIQKGTRTLQSICNETKTKKDKKLVALIPPCRSKLQTLVLKVKQLFKKHDMEDAYSVGELKLKNMGGEELTTEIQPNEIFEPTQANEASSPPSPPLKKGKRNKRFKHHFAQPKPVNLDEEDGEQANENAREDYIAMDEYDE